MSEGLPTFRLISSIEMEKIISVLAWLAGRCFADLLRLCCERETGVRLVVVVVLAETHV